MLAVRKLRTPSLARATAACCVQRKSFSNGTAKRPPIFEMRRYGVDSGNLNKILESATKRVGIEVGLGSVLRGFWATEGFISGLIQTEIFALWEYEDYNQRHAQWERRKNNTDWVDSVKEMQSYITTQSYTFWNPFPFAPLLLQPREMGGIFEFRNYRVVPGKLGAWQQRFSASFAKRCEYSSPIGVWYSEIGTLNELMHIWPYKSLEHRAEVRAKAAEDPEWGQCIAETAPFLQELRNVILYATPLSPIK